MKTFKKLWENFISFENLYKASQKAQKSKRYKPATLVFNRNLEENLVRLKNDLASGSYAPGPFTSFTIYEPKEREIHASSYRDRVVHHAIINIIEPIWEKRFYHHSYACRAKKGTHRAQDLCQQYLRRSKYALKCDIEKYFPSIDHEILFSLLKKKIRDERLLALIQLIINSSPEMNAPVRYFPGDDLLTPVERRKGIPIGNLTSQFFANLVLHELDCFIKYQQRINYYVRYMDDFLIFADDKASLSELRSEIRNFLATLRLTLHPKKQEIFPVKNGVPFLGLLIYHDHRRLRPENVRRFIKRMRRYQIGYARGEINLKTVRQSMMSWLGHAHHADSWHLLGKILYRLEFKKSSCSHEAG